MPSVPLRDQAIVLVMLEFYKNMRYLWDKQHEGFNNKRLRNYVYYILLDIYKRVDAYATVATLTRKIQNLRSNYMKECKKVEDSKKNSANPKDIYVPTLWYFEALSFLDDSCMSNGAGPSSSTRNKIKTEMANDQSPESESDQPITPKTYKTPNKKRRIAKANTRKSVRIQEQKTAQRKESSSFKDEEWEILDKAIGLQLRDLDNKQLTITQKIISDAIYFAKLGSLNEKSFIALNSMDDPEPESDFSHQPDTPCTLQGISLQCNQMIMKTSPDHSNDNDNETVP